MKGFFKRDCYLLLPNMRLYVGIVALMLFLALMTDLSRAATFITMYVFIYMVAGITGLFSYDNYNHWQAYAAAIPGGRRAMVGARYLLTLLSCGLGALLCLLLAAAARNENGAILVVLYSGAALLYAAITLPVCYRFGGDKTRMVMLIVVAVAAGGMAAGGVTLINNVNVPGGAWALPLGEAAVLPVVGLAALAVSWRVSLKIMEAKEL